jgi:hypothetical protein
MSERLLTYEELAEALGRSYEAVRALCIRKRWRRTPGNDGKVRVHVPADVLETLRTANAHRVHTPLNTERSPSVQANDPGAMNGDARALIALLEARAVELQGRVTELGGEVKEARAVNASVTAKNEELLAKACRVDVLEALLDAERRRGDELRTERDRLVTALTDQRGHGGLLTRLRRWIG